MPRWTIALLIVTVMVVACGGAADASPTARTADGPHPDATTAPSSKATSMASSAVATPSRVGGSPTPETRPTPKPIEMTDVERELEVVLRDDARDNCEPRRSDLPRGATAGVECRIESRLVDRVAVYGFMAHDEREDADQTYLDRAALAYLDRMDRQDVLGSSGECVGGTPQDVSWMGAAADTPGSNVYLQVDYEGRPYSVHRYGCFVNEQGVANFRATCGEGVYVGVLGRTARLDQLTRWALRWPDPDGMSFPMPGICAGQQRDTY